MIEISLGCEAECENLIQAWLKGFRPHAIFAVLDVPETMDDYKKMMISTFRNRYNHSLRMGYYSLRMDNQMRNERLDQLHDINISLPYRQGREMNENYKEYPKVTSQIFTCQKHYNELFGVFAPDGTWVGYISLLVINNFANISQILGHGEHLKKTGIMINLWMKVVEFCIYKKLDYIIYYEYHSGNGGLEFWKKSVGMKPHQIKLV